MFRELTINSVVEAADTDAMGIVGYIQSLIDADDQAIPTAVVSKENILKAQALQAYYANTHSYLLGLWGALRVSAGTNKARISVRDYLEGAVSSCKLRYSAASRVLTGYQTISGDAGMGERTL